MERTTSKLPLLYALLPPLVAVVVFVLVSSPFMGVVRIAQYVIYALSASVIAGGLVYITASSPDDLASRWLVSVMYEAVAFAITLWIICALVATRILYPERFLLIGPTRGSLFDLDVLFQSVSYATIGAATTATAISAVVLLMGFWRGGLGDRIWPWPWRQRGGD